MPVLACREMADAARGITRQKGADFSVKGDHFLENGVIAVQIRECRFQIVARAQPSLSLAVISKAAGLQDGGRGQGFHRLRKVRGVADLPIARCRNAQTGRQRFSGYTVLAAWSAAAPGLANMTCRSPPLSRRAHFQIRWSRRPCRCKRGCRHIVIGCRRGARGDFAGRAGIRVGGVDVGFQSKLAAAIASMRPSWPRQGCRSIVARHCRRRAS